MKKLTFLLIITTFIIKAQSPISEVFPEPNKDVSLVGNLNQGKKVSDLSWAWSSLNACFPETQKQKFIGNHVFFTGIIPTYSELTITVIPKDPKANFSIYAYKVGKDKMPIVPNLRSCISCEADYKRDRKKRGRTQDHTRTVSGLNALSYSYRVIIGVAGAEGLEEGEFSLVISTKSR